MTDASVNAAEQAMKNLNVKDSDKVSEPVSDASKPAAATGADAGEAADSTKESGEAGTAPTQMNTASLYVGELDPSVSEAVLFEVFSAVGPVASIRVCRDAVTRDSLGYAYVNFHNQDDAKKALEELNYAQIRGSPIRLMWSQRDPSVRKSGRGNIFIKNLDSSVDNKALHQTFAQFGDILSAKVVTDAQGNSLGFGFIHFDEPESADQAIRLVNGMMLNDREVYVARHIPRSERDSKVDSLKNQFTNIYVKNLDSSVDQKGLEEMFAKYGEITSAVISTDAEGNSRGFGFVNYADHEAAAKAVEALNDSETGKEGRKLYVGRAQNKFERQTELKKQHEAARLEKLTKYQGVNLYVKNLDDSVNDETLKETFAPFGTITSSKVMTDDQGKSRGFGFVCYSTPEEANRAIGELNQHVLGSKPLYVALAQRKDLRQTQMRQQLNARNQLRLQQQAAAGGLGGQFIGGPMMYPGQPPFINGAPGNRVPFPGNPQVMMSPRGNVPPMGQWQAGPGGPRGPVPYGYPGAPSGPGAGPQDAPAGGAAKPDSLAAIVASVPAEAKKQVIGEALYPKILAQSQINNDGELAGKITGMLLDMENDELIALTEDNAALSEQVGEALTAYNTYLESEAAEKSK